MVRKYINLDYEGEDTDTFNKLLEAIRDDTLTIDSQKKIIESLEETSKDYKLWTDLKIDSLESTRDRILEAWGMGFTKTQYDDIEEIADYAIQNDY